jgi:hypothetical protein
MSAKILYGKIMEPGEGLGTRSSGSSGREGARDDRALLPGMIWKAPRLLLARPSVGEAGR